MTQADENAGGQPPPASKTRAPRMPWLAFGLLVAAAALATVWQRWSTLAPAAPEATAEAGIAELAPSAPSAPSALSAPPQPEVVAEAAPPAPAKNENIRKAVHEFRVALDVSAFDDDGDALTCEWQQTGGPGVRIRGADKPRACFMAREPGRYVFAIRVSDGKDTTIAQVVRNVKDADLLPVPPGKE